MTGPAGPEHGPGLTGPAGPEPFWAGALARFRGPAAVTLLVAVTIAWAALPVAGARPGTRAALVIAVGCAALSLVHLAIGNAVIGGDAFDPALVRLAAEAAHLVRTLPWSETMIIAVLILEALHHSRPWHTAVLGVALLAYLFAAHLAETASRPGVFRPQLPVIAAGLGLLTLAVGAAALPHLHAGPASELLRVLATIAAVLAGALALPTTPRPPAPRPTASRATASSPAASRATASSPAASSPAASGPAAPRPDSIPPGPPPDRS